MVDIAFIRQLVDSMESSVFRMEQAILRKDFNEANKLRTFIFDLHLQINKSLEVRNV